MAVGRLRQGAARSGAPEAGRRNFCAAFIGSGPPASLRAMADSGPTALPLGIYLCRFDEDSVPDAALEPALAALPVRGQRASSGVWVPP